MTTTLSIHTTETDPERGIDALQRAVALIAELKAIPGLRVIVGGDLQVTAKHEAPEDEKTRLIKDIRKRLPIVAIGHPELVAQIEEALTAVENES